MKRFSLYVRVLVLFLVSFLVYSCSNQTNLINEDIENFLAQSVIKSEFQNESQLLIPVDVIILAGQSNATGSASYNEELRSFVSSEDFDLFNNGFENINIIALTDWSMSGWQSNLINFTKVKFGQGANDSMFGPEIGIAYSIKNELNRNVVLIKYTSPGNYIDFFLEDKNISYGFSSFVKLSLQILKNKGYLPAVKALCWMQGESDSIKYNTAMEYIKKQRNLVDSIRKEFGENIVFVDAPVTDWDLVCPVNFQTIVNDAKKKISSDSENNYLVNSQGLKKNPNDLCHYDAKSEFELGLRMGKFLVDSKVFQ